MTDLHPDAEHQAHLTEGRLMLLRSRSGGRAFFHPRVAQPGTGATDLEWVEASGRGVVYSTTVVRAKPPAESYNVALIDLAEGPRLMSKVVGLAPEAVRIGMAVRSRIDATEAGPLLVFEPVDAGEAGR